MAVVAGWPEERFGSQGSVKVFPVERFMPAVAWRMLLLKARATAYGGRRWRPATQAESWETSLLTTSNRTNTGNVHLDQSRERFIGVKVQI
jgi:hypothetical protein